MKKYITLKYNEDDVLEILTEHLAIKYGFNAFNSRAIFYGNPSQDLRMVCVIGESEDHKVNEVDLEALDEEIDYNGPHSKYHYITDISKLLNRKKGDF